MKTAVVLNDTSQRHHHGCSRVMRNLTQGVAGQGIAVIGTSLAHGDWRRDAAFLAALARADVLVINGEGTIHDGAPAARRLLDILDAPNVATARWCC